MKTESTSNFKSLRNAINFLPNKKLIVFFPGSFKPPTRYHWEGITTYAEIADEVYIIISNPQSSKSQRNTIVGKPISAEASKEIFDIYIENFGVKNVKTIISESPSPIGYTIKLIENNENGFFNNTNILLGVSNKDNDESRFISLEKKMKSIMEENPTINFLNLNGGTKKYSLDYNFEGRTSASDCRNHIDNESYLIDNYLPLGLSRQNTLRVLQILSDELEINYPSLNNSFNKKTTKESIETPRKSLEKLDRLSGKKSIEIVKYLNEQFSKQTELSITLFQKVDGQAIRVAVTKDDVFLESSHSGLVSDPSKFDSFIPHFGTVLRTLKTKHKLLQSILPENIFGYKIVGELLYNDKDYRDEDNTITVVGTTYKSEELGELASIVIRKVEIMPNQESINNADSETQNVIIKFFVESVSEKEKITFIDANILSWSITIKQNNFSDKSLNIIFNLGNKNEKFDRQDAEQAKFVLQELNDIIIKSFSEKANLTLIKSDKSLEGVVFRIGDNNVELAVQNPEWVKIKTQNTQFGHKFQETVLNFMKTVFGIPEKSNLPRLKELILRLKNDDQDIKEIERNFNQNFNQFKQTLNDVYSDIIQSLANSDYPKFIINTQMHVINNTFNMFQNIQNFNDFKNFLIERYNNIMNKKENRKFDLNNYQIVSEGGNMFKTPSGENLVDRINQENVAATLEKIQNEIFDYLNIKPENTSPLGSTGKKLPGSSSGDIDIGVDLVKSGYVFPNTKDEDNRGLQYFWKDLEEACEYYDYAYVKNKGFKLFSVAFPIVNVDGKQKDKFVQVDIMGTTNLNMLKFGYASPYEKDSPWKGAVRNALLSAITSSVFSRDVPEDEIPGDQKTVVTKNDKGIEEIKSAMRKTLSFDPRTGLWRKIKDYRRSDKSNASLKTPKVVDKVFLTDDPNTIIRIFLVGQNGKVPSQNDILTVEGLWEAFKKSIFWSPKIEDDVKKTMQDIMEKQHPDIPFPDFLKTNSK